MTHIDVDPGLIAQLGNEYGSVADSLNNTIRNFDAATSNLQDDMGGGSAGSAGSTFVSNTDHTLKSLQTTLQSISAALAKAAGNVGVAELDSTQTGYRRGSPR